MFVFVDAPVFICLCWGFSVDMLLSIRLIVVDIVVLTCLYSFTVALHIVNVLVFTCLCCGRIGVNYFVLWMYCLLTLCCWCGGVYMFVSPAQGRALFCSEAGGVVCKSLVTPETPRLVPHSRQVWTWKHGLHFVERGGELEHYSCNKHTSGALIALSLVVRLLMEVLYLDQLSLDFVITKWKVPTWFVSVPPLRHRDLSRAW